MHKILLLFSNTTRRTIIMHLLQLLLYITLCSIQCLAIGDIVNVVQIDGEEVSYKAWFTFTRRSEELKSKMERNYLSAATELDVKYSEPFYAFLYMQYFKRDEVPPATLEPKLMALTPLVMVQPGKAKFFETSEYLAKILYANKEQRFVILLMKSTIDKYRLNI